MAPVHAGLTVSKGYVAPAQKQGIDDQRFVALNGLIATNVSPMSCLCAWLQIMCSTAKHAACTSHPTGLCICLLQHAHAGCDHTCTSSSAGSCSAIQEQVTVATSWLPVSSD